MRHPWHRDTLIGGRMKPHASTWRELLISDRAAHQTEDEIREVSSRYGISPEYYDTTACERYWWDHSRSITIAISRRSSNLSQRAYTAVTPLQVCASSAPICSSE
jgi:hypothetical protein